MDTLAVGQPAPPVPLVVLYVPCRLFGFVGDAEPVELPLAVLLVIEELADVQVPIFVDLDAGPSPLVVLELALVELALPVDADPHPRSPLVDHLPEVDLAVVLD